MPNARLACLFLLLTGMAHAADRLPSVCGRPEVLGVVADDIARGGTDTVIIPGDFGEVPTAQPDTVRCAVRVNTRIVDTNRFGYVPQDRQSIVEFSVRTGRNGLFVDDIGAVR
ncbi:MAG: hypothetical protein H7Z10_11170 [Gemmatimonadaceae bacterium]|nr:hypothetical protein [Acetobacteraceae bacterium]